MLIFGTFLFCVASALIPVLNAEAYLAVMATQMPDLSYWQIAVVGAAGQTVGKLIWFYAGIYSMKLPWLQRKMDKPTWQEKYDRWSERINGRPFVSGALCATAGVIGVPPLAIVAVLAGALRMNVVIFTVTVFAGRVIRFWVVLAGAGELIKLWG